MSHFIAGTDQPLLARHGLADFQSLWDVQLDAVDEPNTGRGGWSSVFRLELEGSGFYLKRQSNYLTHTLHHPFGEPSFSREFRNISRYQKLGIPALQAVFFGEHVFIAAGKADWAAVAISAAACVALLRYKVGTIKLLAACALAGLVLSYWHG